MARTNSKYFSSVIEKLIASKRKENIVVDNDLKERLRTNLMARADMMAQPEKAGFGDLWTKWRYAFALVPSALILVLVAAHVMNLPVEMESDVVVPVTSTRDNQENAQKGGDVEDSEDDEAVGDDSVSEDARDNDSKVSLFEDMEMEDLGDIEDEADQRKIRTFPGSLVMPNSTSETVVSGAKVTADDVAGDDDQYIGPGETEESTGDDDNVGDYNFNMPVQFMPYYYQPEGVVSDDEKEYGKDYKYIERDDDEGEDRTDEGGGLNVLNDKGLNVESAGDAIDEGLGGGNEGSMNEGESGEGGTEEAPNMSPVLVDVPVIEPPLEPEGLVVQKPSLRVRDGGLSEEQDSSLRVVYETVLTDVEKTSLNRQVIEGLTTGKDVNSVVVDRDSNNIVNVEIYYEDGSVVVKTYLFNSVTGYWDTVQYVSQEYQSGITYRVFNPNYIPSL